MFRALRLSRYIVLGLLVAVLAGGLPSKWFGLAGQKVGEVERLASCMKRHEGALGDIIKNIGSPSSVLHETPAKRKAEVRAAEKRRRIDKREGDAIVACARTVAPEASTQSK
jgi:hypothetical protein